MSADNYFAAGLHCGSHFEPHRLLQVLCAFMQNQISTVSINTNSLQYWQLLYNKISYTVPKTGIPGDTTKYSKIDYYCTVYDSKDRCNVVSLCFTG